jgi:hypothetical protein
LTLYLLRECCGCTADSFDEFMNNTVQELVSDDSNDIHIKRAEQYMPHATGAAAEEGHVNKLHIHFGQVYLSTPVVIEKVRFTNISMTYCCSVCYCHTVV